VFERYPDQVLDTHVLEFPAETEALIVTLSDLGMSLLKEGGSGVVISKQPTHASVVFEHFGSGTSWAEGRSYDVYAKALLDQAKGRGVKSECEGEGLIESVRFHFTYDSCQTSTLREIIGWTVDTLSEIVQDAELSLSGGPKWQDTYERDELLFCKEVLSPLLRRMGFLFVRYTHGRKEYGKDFTFSEETKFGELRHYGLQAKAGNVRGGVRSEVDPILKQIKKAFRMPYHEPGETNPRYISTFIVAISGCFTENAEEEIREEMRQRWRIGSVFFWDKERILSLIAQYWGST